MEGAQEKALAEAHKEALNGPRRRPRKPWKAWRPCRPWRPWRRPWPWTRPRRRSWRLGEGLEALEAQELVYASGVGAKKIEIGDPKALSLLEWLRADFPTIF